MRSNAIRNFKQMTITGDELENIFIPDKRKVCQTCHKVRIKALISKYDFDENHRENICFCQIHHNQNPHQQNHHQHDQQIQQGENLNQHGGQIPQNEEQNNPGQNIEENENEPNIEPQENEEGNQYVTKREFNEFKEQITKEIQDIKVDLKKSFDVISEINKKI